MIFLPRHIPWRDEVELGEALSSQPSPSSFEEQLCRAQVYLGVMERLTGMMRCPDGSLYVYGDSLISACSIGVLHDENDKERLAKSMMRRFNLRKAFGARRKRAVKIMAALISDMQRVDERFKMVRDLVAHARCVPMISPGRTKILLVEDRSLPVYRRLADGEPLQ